MRTAWIGAISRLLDPLVTLARRHPRFSSVSFLFLVTIACLAPFAGKPFHIDDPLFLWTAKQIQSHPLDFYGFNVNWYGTEMPMAEVNNNPPLAAYYIALATAVFGWTEIALHLAFLLPACLAAWGTYELARHFCARPLLAALAGTLTPVFLISSTTVMCDVPMLAFWVWALAFWVRGVQEGNLPQLLLGGLLAGGCVLTKFSGMMLIPLLLFCALAKWQRMGRSVLALLIPILFIAGYEWWTHAQYGRGLFLFATSFAPSMRPVLDKEILQHIAVGLIFTGGCLLTALFYAPLLWSWRAILVSLFFVALFLFMTASGQRLGNYSLIEAGNLKWGTLLQGGLLALAGVNVLALVGADLWDQRDANSLLLALWVLGVFIFASMLNWTVSGRSLLPMAPTAGILIARRLGRRPRTARPGWDWRMAWPLIPSAVCALVLVRADYALADSARVAAQQLSAKYKSDKATLWFEGHWGFQYYMQQCAAKALDYNASSLLVGDLVVIPSNNTSINDLPRAIMRQVDATELRPNLHVAIMNREKGAGFYSDLWGPLPFAVGSISPERYYVGTVNSPLSLVATLPSGINDGSTSEQGLASDAIAEYRAQLAADPNNAAAHFFLGVLLFGCSQEQEAAQHFQEVLRLEPASGEAHARLGLILDRQQKTSEAVRHYREALRLRAAMPVVANNLAWILATHPNPKFRNGREAVQMARRACIQTSYKQPVMLGTLAAAYAEAGRFEDAVRTGEQARELAQAAGQMELAEKNAKLIELYRAGKPYREAAPDSSSDSP